MADNASPCKKRKRKSGPNHPPSLFICRGIPPGEIAVQYSQFLPRSQTTSGKENTQSTGSVMGNAKSFLEQKGYILLEETQQGAFGKTLQVKRKKDGEECVIKVLQKSEAVMKEVTVLQGLNHPFIVQYQGDFEDDMNVYMVMEHCDGGNLSQKIKEQKDTGIYFTEDDILAWFVEICMAVEHVHGKNILHRDIKPENIFLDKNGRICLGDFGLAKSLERSSGYAKSAVGTFNYRSPEIIQEEAYSSKSDVWSLGCVLYELCELQRAFPEENFQKLFNKIADGPYPSISAVFSFDLHDLVRDMLQKNPADRPSAVEIVGRPLFLGIIIQKTRGIPEKLLQKLGELEGVADGLERVHFGTRVGSLTGGVIGAAGGIATIVGLFLAPVTAGASLIVTGVGLGVATAGGLTGAASHFTNMVKERIDRAAIESIVRECEALTLMLVSCLQLIDRGFENMEHGRPLNPAEASRLVRALGGLAKLAPTIGAFRGAAQAVRLAKATEVVTGVFAGLFLLVDIYFIVDDSMEIHAMRQQRSGAYAKLEEQSSDEVSASPQGRATSTPDASSASREGAKMEDPDWSSDEASAGPESGTAEGAKPAEGGKPAEGMKPDEGKKELKTREFIQKIRDVSAELRKWLRGLESVYSTITKIEEAFMSF